MTDERREIAKRVMKAMRHPVTRAPLTSNHLVICLRTDTVEYAAERVTAAGGTATVVVPHRGGLVPLGWTMLSGDALPLGDLPEIVHPDSELGMVVDLIDASGETTFSFKMATVAVTEGDVLTVPA